MSAKLSRWDWLIALALCAIAAGAILIALPTPRWYHRTARSPEPLAPGLAALSDQQLSDLLPKPRDFPSSWVVKPQNSYDWFGYHRMQPFHDALGDEPAECANVGELAVGARPGAEISGYDPAHQDRLSYQPRDVSLTIAREFNRQGFDAMIDLVSRCGQFTSGKVLSYTVRVLEDFRPDGGPQRFRIVRTTAADDGDPKVARTEYFSYARVSRLVLTGFATTANQQLLDTLFDNTLHRINTP